MKLTGSPLVVVALLRFATAKQTAIGADDVAVGAACLAVVEQFQYGCANTNGTDYSCSCVNPVYMGSVLCCIQSNVKTYEQEQQERGILSGACLGSTKISLSQRDLDILYINASQYLTDVSLEDLETVEQYRPFKVPSSLLVSYTEAASAMNRNKFLSRMLG
jgi:hypothetical protein